MAPGAGRGHRHSTWCDRYIPMWQVCVTATPHYTRGMQCAHDNAAEEPGRVARSCGVCVYVRVCVCVCACSWLDPSEPATLNQTLVPRYVRVYNHACTTATHADTHTHTHVSRRSLTCRQTDQSVRGSRGQCVCMYVCVCVCVSQGCKRGSHRSAHLRGHSVHQ